MRINIGVIDAPRLDDKNTGEVAKDLETRYKVFETFYNKYPEKVTDAVSERIFDMIETGQSLENVFIDDVQEAIVEWIDSQQAESDIRGLPSRAALLGVNHRKANPMTGVRRASLVDTGVYSNSIRCWID